MPANSRQQAKFVRNQARSPKKLNKSAKELKQRAPKIKPGALIKNEKRDYFSRHRKSHHRKTNQGLQSEYRPHKFTVRRTAEKPQNSSRPFSTRNLGSSSKFKLPNC